MLAVLLLLGAIEGLSQYYAGIIYHLMAFVNGTALIGPNFITNTEGMLKACGSAIILFIVGFYFIKVNFLLFFYRLGNRAARIFRIVWWVVFGIVLACGIASVTMGVPTFHCLFAGIIYTFTTCETVEYENKFFTYFRASIALDIFTDGLSEFSTDPYLGPSSLYLLGEEKGSCADFQSLRFPGLDPLGRSYQSPEKDCPCSHLFPGGIHYRCDHTPWRPIERGI